MELYEGGVDFVNKDGDHGVFGPCKRCQRFRGSPIWNQGQILGPFTALQGHAFCEFCYPIVAAIVHADKLLEVK